MIVGCLGGIIFAVFDGYVKTIKDMVQSVSARYTTHQRAGGKALAEFTGTDADTKQREILMGYVDNHTTLPFVLGNEVFGSYRWVIKSVKFKTKHTDAFGVPTWITASVTLLEYPRE